ncbi:unnamed protein product [Durusdinium trenchii]|uniref:Uncharacterized protein n=1 Tax=Durusdinium trenchii TaxID=1381693 RepID=A0ABP0KQU6_9DINO
MSRAVECDQCPLRLSRRAALTLHKLAVPLVVLHLVDFICQTSNPAQNQRDLMVFEVFSGVSRIYSTAREQRLKSDYYDVLWRPRVNDLLGMSGLIYAVRQTLRLVPSVIWEPTSTCPGNSPWCLGRGLEFLCSTASSPGRGMKHKVVIAKKTGKSVCGGKDLKRTGEYTKPFARKVVKEFCNLTAGEKEEASNVDFERMSPLNAPVQWKHLDLKQIEEFLQQRIDDGSFHPQFAWKPEHLA